MPLARKIIIRSPGTGFYFYMARLARNLIAPRLTQVVRVGNHRRHIFRERIEVNSFKTIKKAFLDIAYSGLCSHWIIKIIVGVTHHTIRGLNIVTVTTSFPIGNKGDI